MKGLGVELMKNSIELAHKVFGSDKIRIGAQKYLRKFYEDLGFVKTGEEYLEDGIPHIHMVRERS